MAKLFKWFSRDTGFVKVYHGYGHTHDLFVFGHVFKTKPVTIQHYTTNVLVNIIHLLRLFFVKPFANARVQLNWQNQLLLQGTAEDDGFFKFEWRAGQEINAGWHHLQIDHLDPNGKIKGSGMGKVYVPHSTQFGFISDIDDTIMISHSATIFRRLKELFIRNSRTRTMFLDVARHYELLALAHTTALTPNPFFYVSSSEWNLYDYLVEFFRFNGLPEGIFLLNQVKRWFQLLKTGKTKHQGKLLRVARIMEAFPQQRFVLLGDNSQADPAIYEAISRKYPGRIFAIYIRNINKKNETITSQVLSAAEKNNVHVCQFANSNEAIEHSRRVGLIE